MATTNARSQRLKSRQRSQQIRNQRKNQTKPFEGEATRMYKGIEYPLSMLKTNTRGRVLGVKETVDSQGPNPTPSIEKIEKQNKSDNTSDNKNTRKQSTVTKATTKSIDSGKKQSIDKMQNKINATDQANFEAARKKLRGVGASMDDMSKAAADTNIELVSKSKDINPETNVSNTKKERRQLLRARRRAGRKSTDGTYTADQLRAERDKIKSRSIARKDYLRNFASQLARGEQAAPRTGFGQGEGNPNADTSLTGNSGTQQEVTSNSELAKSDYKDIFSTMANIGNDNSSLTSVSYDRGMGGLLSPNLKLDEDSSPTTYMQKEYRKKRGY